jgi:hypothetical protein
MATISMQKNTIVEVVEFVIIVEDKIPMKWKNMARYHQNVFDNDELDDSNDEDEHHEKKTKKNLIRFA